MPSTCPRCQAATEPGDRFCPACGAALPDAEAGHAAAAPARPWYRRKRVIIPIVIIALLAVAIAGVGYAVLDRFDTINSVSTPPPVVTGSQLGGDEDVTVDTGPAQDAIRRAQEERESTPVSGQPPSGTNGRALMRFALQDDATPASPAPTPDPDSLAVAPVDTGDAILVLLMGVDARPGEAIDVGVRPDSLVALNLDPETGACRILSIPRDTRVELPGYGASKVNHALAIGGIPYQVLVVEEMLGVRFDHYGLIDFAGIEKLVDSLGGITVVNETAFTYEGYDFPEGELELDGEHALIYVTYRGDEDGDFGRQRRQHAVVRAMLDVGASLDVVTAVPQLLDAVEDHIRTDAGPRRLVDLAQEFQPTCTAESLLTRQLEGEVATLHDVIFDEPLSFVVVDEAEAEAQLHWLLTGEDLTPASPVASPAATPQATLPRPAPLTRARA